MQNEINSMRVIIPVYNEEGGLPDLIDALSDLKARMVGVSLYVTFVDDHSEDRSPQLLREACERFDWFSYLRLSRNHGSHAAIYAGLERCDEDCAAFIASDLQDPPELLLEMMERCRDRHDVVWGVWADHEQISRLERGMSRLFHALLYYLSHLEGVPFGASCALLSRRAYKALISRMGARPSLVADIPRLGFDVAVVPFVKPERAHGTSKWTLRKKLLAFADALVSSTYVPIRTMSYMGMLISVLGFLYAMVLIVMRLVVQTPVPGWTATMVVILMIGGLTMLMMGVMGEYLWRTLEEVRRNSRPIVQEERNISTEHSDESGPASR